MEFLVFQLLAPLSSWGEPAVGEFRGSAEHPSQSALIGLLAAALGIDRQDEAAHATLRDGYGYAVAVLSGGSLLRDYHTVQVPPTAKLKGRPHNTRRDELAIRKNDLTTILSTRDYRQNAASLVALQVRQGVQPAHSLSHLCAALREPVFTLYLGRKSCPPGAPLWPHVLTAPNVLEAFQEYRRRHATAAAQAVTRRGQPGLEPLPTMMRLTFDDQIVAGVAADLTTRRKDRLIRRSGWQFGDRDEHVTLFVPEA